MGGPVKRSFWILPLFLVCLATSIGSVGYIMGSPEAFDYPFAEKYRQNLFLVRTHGLAAALCLLLGPLGFVSRLPLHRQRGRIYVLSVLIAGLTAIPLSLIAEGGLLSQTGFLLLSVLWLYSGVELWRTAVRRDFQAHRIWVVRCFALAFGAVILRVLLNSVQEFGYSFQEYYAVTVWVSWAIAMGGGEFLIFGALREDQID